MNQEAACKITYHQVVCRLVCAFTISLALAASLVCRASAEEPADEARLELLQNVGVKGSQFYLYSPLSPNLEFTMSPMLNSVIFVYPDKPYAGEMETWAGLKRFGLLELAEREAAYIIVPTPLNGGSWQAADLKVYYESQYYLAGGDAVGQDGMLPKFQYKRRVYNNQQYIIAEGSGASFVNNVLSQHAERIAGILTFGGQLADSAKGGLAVPAYLVAPDRAAFAYYKAVNQVDTEVSTGVFENSRYKLKKVIRADGQAHFEAGAISAAWDEIFSRTMRACVTDNVVLNNKTSSEWVLMDRPNYKALGITRVDHKQGVLPGGSQTTWYDFVPDKVLANPQAKAPLVIVLHGFGDDPIYQAESNGWVAKAAQENFILISPDYPGMNAEGEKAVMQVVAYAKSKYPVDESRIYLSGFSMGGGSTAMIGIKNVQTFAGIAVMGASGAAVDASTDLSMQRRLGLPFVMIIGTADSLNVQTDEKDVKCVGSGIFKGGLETLMKINGLATENRNCSVHPYWGYPTTGAEVVLARNLRYDVSIMRKDGAEKPAAKLVLFENAGHAHSDQYATLAWDFLKQFSRAAN
jgi:poly(3-hydroxybutyrate) depolymerase